MGAEIRSASHPALLLSHEGVVHLATEQGEWWRIGKHSDRAEKFPPTGPFLAALLDARGVPAVAAYGSEVLRLEEGEWRRIETGAPVSALALLDGDLIAGDTAGRAIFIDASSEPLLVGAPVLELIEADWARLALLTAGGKVVSAARPFVGVQPLKLDPIVRAFALFRGARGTVGAIGRERIVQIDVASRETVASSPRFEDGVSDVCPIDDRFAVITGLGELVMLDRALRPSRLEKADQTVASAIANGRDLFVWTIDGGAYFVKPNGDVMPFAKKGVVLAGEGAVVIDEGDGVFLVEPLEG